MLEKLSVAFEGLMGHVVMALEVPALAVSLALAGLGLLPAFSRLVSRLLVSRLVRTPCALTYSSCGKGRQLLRGRGRSRSCWSKEALRIGACHSNGDRLERPLIPLLSAAWMKDSACPPQYLQWGEAAEGGERCGKEKEGGVGARGHDVTLGGLRVIA